MKRIASLVLAFALSLSAASAQKSPEESAGWKLGAQAYSFNRYDFAQALKKIDSCGLKYVEAFPGQRIGGGLEGKMDFKMDAATRQAVKQLVKDKGLTLVAYGVVNTPTEAEWRQLMEFAKDMGILNINTEPKVDQMTYVGKLAREFKINVCLHNHPKPSHYWHPDSVLAVIGTNQYLGSCADIGHWTRSGLDPVACLKQLEGHVLGMHFKDLEEKAAKTHDVVWGTGVNNIPGVLAELKRQKFKGPISAEYEYKWENNGPEIAESARNFRRIFKEGK